MRPATSPTATHVHRAARPADVTCTINNNDNAPPLHLRKTVTNDNGGTALRHGLDADRDGPGHADEPVRLDPGRQRRELQGRHLHAGGERRPRRLHRGRLECVHGHACPTATPCHGRRSAQTSTCTINNNDNAPALHLRKTVTNDNGGTALDDRLDADRDRHGRHADEPVGRDAGRQRRASRPTPTRLAESGGPAGYTAGAWSCTAARQTGSTPRHGRARRDVDVHDQQQRQRAAAAPAQDGRPTTTAAPPLATAWTLTATGTAPTRRQPVGPTPVDSARRSSAGTYALAESGARPATPPRVVLHRRHARPARTITVALGERRDLHDHQQRQRAGAAPAQDGDNDNGGTALATAWTLTATGRATRRRTCRARRRSTAARRSRPTRMRWLRAAAPRATPRAAWSCVVTGTSGRSVTAARSRSGSGRT